MISKPEQINRFRNKTEKYNHLFRLNQKEVLVISRYMDRIVLDYHKTGISRYLGYEYFV